LGCNPSVATDILLSKSSSSFYFWDDIVVVVEVAFEDKTQLSVKAWYVFVTLFPLSVKRIFASIPFL
jgi:hypothetical protein